MMSYNKGMHPIERVLIADLRPIFIGSEFLEKENTLNLIISCRMFSNMEIEERIKLVYNVIDKCEEIKDKPLVIVQAFSEEEMNELLETIF